MGEIRTRLRASQSEFLDLDNNVTVAEAAADRLDRAIAVFRGLQAAPAVWAALPADTQRDIEALLNDPLI